MFPPMTAEGVLGAAFLPTDGYIDPSQLTFALIEGARRRGVEVCEDTRVTAIEVKDGGVHRVITDKGDVETELIVDAGGMFAPEIGRMAGVNVPLIPFAHEYLITRPSGLPLDMPTVRDPSLLVYYRPESGGLVMGGYERNPKPWGLDGIPNDFNGRLLEPDWERFEPLMNNAIVRTPSLKEAEVVRLVNGPEAFTPDNEFILGPSEVRGFWVAAGFCAHGLAGAGGMGRLVAEWIAEGKPSLDVWEMDSRRFGRAYFSRDYTLARTYEVYSTYYDVKYPGHERTAGRPLRVSPLYSRLKDLGAAFGEKSGCERANWFEPNGTHGDVSLRPHGWAGRLWPPASGLGDPDARDTLEKTTPADISNAAFPFMTAGEIAIGTVPCLALRVTDVGELGWELYCPSEYGLRLWDTIREAGHGRGLRPGGYKAVDSLRLEKGYRVWGADITPDTDPYQAGLGFCVKLDKGEFIGRAALLRKRESPADTRLVCLVLDEPRRVVLGSEPVRIEGEVVGRVTSGGYGYTLGQSIAYAYIPSTCPIDTPVDVDIFGTWVRGRVAKEPLYDPAGLRVRTWGAEREESRPG